VVSPREDESGAEERALCGTSLDRLAVHFQTRSRSAEETSPRKERENGGKKKERNVEKSEIPRAIADLRTHDRTCAIRLP